MRRRFLRSNHNRNRLWFLRSTILTVNCCFLVILPPSSSPNTTLSSLDAKPQLPIPVSSSYTETIPGTSIKFEMMPLPAGTISLADSARPGNKISVMIKPIWIGKTEVTWDEYDLYAFKLDMTANQKIGELDAIARPTKPYGAPDRGFGHRGYPALSMTFHAAQEYCRWLSAKTGKKYRLPTEAEWEYACQAGTMEKLSLVNLDQQAWYWDNAEDKTHPVATKQPNNWGLYDMLGNAAEWVVGNDGAAIVAGGAFKDKAEKVYAGAREKQAPSWNVTDPQMPKSKWWLSDAMFVGFRVVCEP